MQVKHNTMYIMYNLKNINLPRLQAVAANTAAVGRYRAVFVIEHVLLQSLIIFGAIKCNSKGFQTLIMKLERKILTVGLAIVQPFYFLQSHRENSVKQQSE